uniref:Uncharacterized protein n=1 Tax=Oryza rufipogon TaxID=4529 RepID=A0A0E0R813_ORYRU
MNGRRASPHKEVQVPSFSDAPRGSPHVATREVWDCLKKRFIGADRVRNMRLQTLKSNINSHRMVNIETLDHYTRKLTAMSVC